MVAKFLDDNKPKTSLKIWTPTVSNFVTLWCVKYWWNFLGLNSKGPYLSLEKEKDNFCVLFTYSIKRAGEIRKFHVAVVPRTAKKCTKKRDAKYKVFCHSRYRRRYLCLSSLLLWSRNFATMVTWRHTSPLYHYVKYRQIVKFRLCSHSTGRIFDRLKIHAFRCTVDMEPR